MMRETLARVDEGALRAGRWDAWGQALSVLCMAHCALLPLALGALPAVLSQSLEEAPLHLAVLPLAAVLGGVSFVPGFRQHRDWRVLALGTAGLALLGLAQTVLPEGVAETAMTLAGGTTLVVAHGLNRRRCRDCCPVALPRSP
ncbi:MAG TPA: MerC domain-containing protein [Archangium sp.]|uniref:MerC domain-containing protein n=1 Tax=Archangium sp. TaxID=1872627 RepID=UPI002E2FC2DE|nr:MerC domain-containing protein [Archangium sp.]HEX5750235.1 MerC domain-containing protein [Archangium sp.]